MQASAKHELLRMGTLLLQHKKAWVRLGAQQCDAELTMVQDLNGLQARLVMQCTADVQELSHQQNQDVRGQLAGFSAALQSRGATPVGLPLLALVQCIRMYHVAEERQ